jgi:hypothetical protein
MERHIIRVSVPVPRVLAAIALAPARATGLLVG